MRGVCLFTSLEIVWRSRNSPREHVSQPCSFSNLLTIHITDGDFSRKYVCLKELGKGSYSTVKLGLEIVRFQEVVPPLTATGN
jgi:hypothetical protein